MAKKDEIPMNLKERVDASFLSEESKVYASEKLAPFFEVLVTLKIFGRVIWSWHFPPKK